MLDKMFLPRSIPESIQDDDILRHALKEKSKEVEGLVERIRNSTTLPMNEIKDFLAKVLK